MAKRQREWARKKTVELRILLGGKCAACGAKSELEFDCIIPRGDTHHKMEFSQRLSFYRREYASGNLRLMCEPCHNKKSASEIYWQETFVLTGKLPF